MMGDVEEARRGGYAFALAVRRATSHCTLAVWRLLSHAWPTRARVHVMGGEACMSVCSGAVDSLFCMSGELPCMVGGPLYDAFAVPDEARLAQGLVIAAGDTRGADPDGRLHWVTRQAYRLTRHALRPDVGRGQPTRCARALLPCASVHGQAPCRLSRRHAR